MNPLLRSTNNPPFNSRLSRRILPIIRKGSQNKLVRQIFIFSSNLYHLDPNSVSTSTRRRKRPLTILATCAPTSPTPVPVAIKALPSSASPKISTMGLATLPLDVAVTTAEPDLMVPEKNGPVMLPPVIGSTIQNG